MFALRVLRMNYRPALHLTSAPDGYLFQGFEDYEVLLVVMRYVNLATCTISNSMYAYVSILARTVYVEA